MMITIRLVGTGAFQTAQLTKQVTRPIFIYPVMLR